MGNLTSRFYQTRQEASPVDLPTAPPLNLPAGAKMHEVYRGYTVVRIADMYDVPTCNVVTTNGKFPDPYKLHPGQHLIILPRSAECPTVHHADQRNEANVHTRSMYVKRCQDASAAL